MKNNQKNQYDKDLAISGSTTLDLPGRQSVRATFRLSESEEKLGRDDPIVRRRRTAMSVYLLDYRYSQPR